MLCVKGNKTEEISEKTLIELGDQYEKIEIDLGTGDGRYVYKAALQNPNTLFIGIDPSKKQLESYSKKANKNKLNNVLFVVGSIEILPFEIENFADKLNILLPWGSLLKEVVDPSEHYIKKLADLLKVGGELETVLGYDENLEPSETNRLNLGEITEDNLRKYSIPIFEKNNLTLKNLNNMEQHELDSLETTWAKRLVHGNKRPVFKLNFTKIS